MKTVMVFGTFDILHPGHEFFLKEAKALGDRLVAVIARDKTVEEVKGRAPVYKEEIRKEKIQELKIADDVVLGETGNKYSIIQKINPDVIALGYDQEVFVSSLSDFFPLIPIIRIAPYRPDIYKSSKLRSSAI